MSVSKVLPGNGSAGNDLVVVHGAGGHLTKGTLEWNAVSESVIPASPLPGVLRIKCSTSGEDKVVPLDEAKAVFFVKTQEGNNVHEEVKFFEYVTPNYVWVRVQFVDGEVLEGRTENSCRLLFDPGIWLQPFDMTGNNSLVYIPRSAVINFHIVGTSQVRLDQPRPASQDGIDVPFSATSGIGEDSATVASVDIS